MQTFTTQAEPVAGQSVAAVQAGPASQLGPPVEPELPELPLDVLPELVPDELAPEPELPDVLDAELDAVVEPELEAEVEPELEPAVLVAEVEPPVLPVLVLDADVAAFEHPESAPSATTTKSSFRLRVEISMVGPSLHPRIVPHNEDVAF